MLSPRALLTEAEAVEIYSYKLCSGNDLLLTGRTTSLSRKYNISPKAIRDIWNHRTWRRATRHMWTAENPTPMAARKQKKSVDRIETHASVDQKQRAYPPNCFSSMLLSGPLAKGQSISWRESLPSYHAISSSAACFQQQHQHNSQETHISRINCRIGQHLEESISHADPITEWQGYASPAYVYPETSKSHSTNNASSLSTSHLLDRGSAVAPPPHTDSLFSDTFTTFGISTANDPFHFDWPHW
jgi:hypothetical protein